MKLFKCMHCGNVVELIKDSGVKVHCCGEPMTRIEEVTEEQGTEKHLPVIEEQGDMLTIKVGEVMHPMTEEHLIEAIFVVDSKGLVERFNLVANQEPVATTYKREGLTVYAYCNVHGLWKVER